MPEHALCAELLEIVLIVCYAVLHEMRQFLLMKRQFHLTAVSDFSGIPDSFRKL